MTKRSDRPPSESDVDVAACSWLKIYAHYTSWERWTFDKEAGLASHPTSENGLVQPDESPTSTVRRKDGETIVFDD